GSINGNISFDSKMNPVSVNLAFFNDCDTKAKFLFASECGSTNNTCPQAPNPYCPNGTKELQGTGFESAGATVWLSTQAPIQGGSEFSIRFAIWDTGDTMLDSTVLVDNFEWVANGGTVAIGTKPVPVPK